MPLIDCPVCNRQISSEAEACPQCGHPNRAAAPAPAPATGPKCYACTAAATTRCPSCGALSCIVHLNSIFMSLVRGYELRCSSCYDSEMAWRTTFGYVFFGILLVFAVVVLIFISSRSS